MEVNTFEFGKRLSDCLNAAVGGETVIISLSTGNRTQVAKLSPYVKTDLPRTQMRVISEEELRENAATTVHNVVYSNYSAIITQDGANVATLTAHKP